MNQNDNTQTPFEHVISAKDLISSELPEPSFVVKGLIPEGLSLLSGKPKRGKSFLALNIATACAKGTKVLGTISTQKQKVLYLALEDTLRRLKKRLVQSVTDTPGLENLHIKTNWDKIGEGGEEKLKSWMLDHTDTSLIIIDTLEKIAPRFGSKSIYSEDYAKIEPLKNIADQHGIAIICIHHLNKRSSDGDAIDLVSGSTGLTGAVDTIMILSRDLNRVDARLYISGRDIEEVELGIDFDKSKGTWTSKGSAKNFELPEKLNEIFQILYESKTSMSPKDIEFHIIKNGGYKSLSTIQTQLKQLVKKGRVRKKSRGQYVAIDFAG